MGRGVSELVNFLQVPFEMTRRLEGSNSVSGFGSLWQTLVNLQVLWRHYRGSCVYDSSPYFQSAVAFGLERLNTCFDRLVIDPTPNFHAIATALHPALRLVWFKGAWKDFHHGTRRPKIRRGLPSSDMSILRLTM